MSRSVKRLIVLLTVLISAISPVAAQPKILPQDVITGAWLFYKAAFVKDDGRVIDTRAAGVSHSEGQGYAMLIAVYADDRKAFDAMWKWTQKNLYTRADGLASWRWNPLSQPHVKDDNNATDGDLLVSWALATAGKKWGNKAYIDEARTIIDALASTAVIDTRLGPVLLPAVYGFSAKDQPDGPVVNLSYWVFPALQELSGLSTRFPADKLIESGIRLFQEARFGDTRLPSDWISIGPDGLRPAQAYPAQAAYDVIRAPLYLAWYSRDYPDLLEPFYKSWTHIAGGRPAVIDLATSTMVSPMQDPGYGAIADLVQCSLGTKKLVADPASFATTDYYPSTLHLLSLIAFAERYPSCLPDLQ